MHKPANFIYDKADHSAIQTQDFVFNQLIPYIGNKRKLLGLIERALSLTDTHSGSTFLDMFTGSGVVSRMAKKLGYRVISNDWEPYSKEINTCYIACNEAPPFAALGGYHTALEALNTLPDREDWITRHLCPDDDDNPDIERDRMFYTRANGLRMDAMRHQVEEWDNAGLLTEEEKACLLAPMLYQTCYTSNTSGVFKGFHNGWGGQTGTALYRILSRFEVKPAVFFDNGQENMVLKMDAGKVPAYLEAAGIRVDVAYLDPPYNQHPYGSNYHVLNTVALWDKPELTEKIQGRNKAAIREDWQTERRSAYNYKASALMEYQKTLQALQARYILTSYSTDGYIPLEGMLEACMSVGQTEFVLQHYKRYRVSSQRFSDKPLNVEFVLVVDAQRPHVGRSAAELAKLIREAEEDALSRHPETATPSLQPSLFD